MTKQLEMQALKQRKKQDFDNIGYKNAYRMLMYMEMFENREIEKNFTHNLKKL